jgi:hypothetical protein
VHRGYTVLLHRRSISSSRFSLGHPRILLTPVSESCTSLACVKPKDTRCKAALLVGTEFSRTCFSSGEPHVAFYEVHAQEVCMNLTRVAFWRFHLRSGPIAGFLLQHSTSTISVACLCQVGRAAIGCNWIMSQNRYGSAVRLRLDWDVGRCTLLAQVYRARVSIHSGHVRPRHDPV